MRQFFQELRRRNVYRVAATYAVVAFVGFQAAQLLIPSTVLPPWTDEFFLFLLIIGFPVALVIAWAFELTPEGVRRTRDVAPSRPDSDGGIVVLEGPTRAAEDVGDDARRSTVRTTALLLLVAVTLAGAVVMWRFTSTGGPGGERAVAPPGGGGERPAVAVLPFVNLSGDSMDRYFTDGVHEEIIGRLSRVSGLDVIARTSVMGYRDGSRSAREIGQELGVTALVGGRVRRSGSRVRISAELIDAEDQVAIWTDDWDRVLDPDSVFEVQEEIARSVVREMDARLTADEETRLGAEPTHDLEAYDYYHLGRQRWHVRDDLREAVDLFESALDRDPDFALAHAGIADVWAVMAWYDTMAPAQAYPRARRAAERALELDPRLAQAHATLGLVAHEFEHDWGRAEEHLRRAIELRPNYASARHWYAILLSNLGRHEEAVREGGKALTLDPHSTVIEGDVAAILWTADRPEEAISMLDRALADEPEAPPVVELERAILLLYESRSDRGAASLERWAQRVGAGDPRAVRTVVRALHDPDRRSEAAGVLSDLVRAGVADRPDLIPLYALLGERQAALAAVDEAREKGSPWLVWMGTLPWYDSLRDEPRFQRTLRELGLPNGR